jgi:hypothetical protein
MAWERFVLATGLDVEQPYPGGARAHHDEGQPVLVNTGGTLYPLIRDKLRPEDGRDQTGRAAAQLREQSGAPPPQSRAARGLAN